MGHVLFTANQQGRRYLVLILKRNKLVENHTSTYCGRGGNISRYEGCLGGPEPGPAISKKPGRILQAFQDLTSSSSTVVRWNLLTGLLRLRINAGNLGTVDLL